MTDATLPFVPPLDAGDESYLDEGHTILSWLTTTDHKRIAILYALSITVFFFIGGVAIGLVRLELISPTGLFLTSDEYNRLFTHPRHHHGVVLPGAVDSRHHGQFHVADDDRRAGRRIPAAQSDVLVSLCRRRGFHHLCLVRRAASTPAGRSIRRSRRIIRTRTCIAAAAGVFIVGFSSIATGVNFLATIHMLRCPGMTWFRLPLFAWSMYVTSMVMVLATPVLAMSLLLTVGAALFRPADLRSDRRR